jgi:2-succinyl-6-hydroxy-2,4-cyclohexadiene-1-carboxylate synthase
VAALVLESTSPGIADALRRAERLASDAELADALERDGIHAFVERWERLPLWESQRALPAATRALLRAQREANNPGGLANSLRGAGAGIDEPVLERLSTVDVPTLLIAGALDTPYVALGRSMERACPTAQLTVVPEAGHAVHLEQPGAFVAAVAAFLREVPGGTRRR